MRIPDLLTCLAAATVCGLAAERLRLPGGLILGAMIGAGTVSLLAGRTIPLPEPVYQGSLIVVGAAVGVMVTREVLLTLRGMIVPAILSAALIVGAGVLIAFLLRGLGMAPPSDILATSPGALSVMAGIAVDHGSGVTEVAMFHLVRVVFVILSMPILAKLLDGPG